MSARQQAVIPSASGYPLYGELTTPIFAKTLIRRYREKAITPMFTSRSIIPADIGEGSEVIFRRAPEAEIFNYQRDQSLDVSTLTTDVIRMSIDHAIYWNLKLDDIDKSRINTSLWVEEFKNDAVYKMDKHICRLILSNVPFQVSKFNKGRCAGIETGLWDLGTLGSPVELTAQNFTMKMASLQAVLDEQDVPMGNLFAIGPPCLRNIFYNPNFPLYSACVSGLQKSSVLMNGETWPTMVGFDFIFTNDLPMLWDPDVGKPCYTILVGRKDAIGLVTDIIKNEVIDKVERHFATYWRGLQVFGFKVLRNEALAAMYVTINTEI